MITTIRYLLGLLLILSLQAQDVTPTHGGGSTSSTGITNGQTGLTLGISAGTITNTTVYGYSTVTPGSLGLQASNSVGIVGGYIKGTTIGGLTYPAADGSTNQVLTTYGNGTLGFTTVAAGAATTNAAELTVGTLDAARLPATAARTDINNQYPVGSTNVFYGPVILGTNIVTANSGTYTAGQLMLRSPTSNITTPGLVITWPSGINFGLCMGPEATGRFTGYGWECVQFQLATSQFEIRDGSGGAHISLYNSFGNPGTTDTYGKANFGTFKVQSTNIILGATGASFNRCLTVAVATNFGTVNAGTTTEVSVGLTYARAGDAVALRMPEALPAGLIFSSTCTTNNTLLLRCHNTLLTNVVVPDGLTYGATVIGY